MLVNIYRFFFRLLICKGLVFGFIMVFGFFVLCDFGKVLVDGIFIFFIVLFFVERLWYWIKIKLVIIVLEM